MRTLLASSSLRVKRVRVIFSAFTSISFLDVVERFLVVLSHKSYPHLRAHCPDLQRPQRPWEEAAEKTLVHPLRWSGLVWSNG